MVDNDYISRANAVQCARDVANDFKNDGFVAEAGGADTVGDWLQDFPAADVRPVRYGKWENHGWSIRCSECGYDMPFATRNFCPNCGAEMEES